MTPDQRELLRRMASGKSNCYSPDEQAALLSLLCELGGAKDRAEWERNFMAARLHKFQGGTSYTPEIHMEINGDKRDWTPERWAEEWKKRELGL